MAERNIHNYYTINPKTNCWEWNKVLNSYGYGHFSYNGKTYIAHRFIYELLIGKLSSNLQLDHLCKNRKCVNPQHLEEVTSAKNVQRGKSAKLSTQIVDTIRNVYKKGVTRQVDLAKTFGVGQDEISRIINNRRWA